MKDKDKKIKVLHVVGGLNRGGVETWLMHLLRNIDRDRFQFDFLVHTDKKCAYDDEARRLGAHIIPNPHPRNPLRYAHNFIRNYRKYGPYDVVHSHVHHYSGFVLLLAKICEVSKRIAHSHSDTRYVDTKAGLFRRFYLKIMEGFIKIFATDGLAASRKAAEALYGAEWEKDGRWQVLYCGIDLEPFKEEWDIAKMRKGFGLPEDAFVMGYVGRFHPQKNHAFLVDIAEEVFKRMPNSYLLLIGDGPLRPEMEEKVRRRGLKDRVVFAGLREDIPRIMRAMDVFVMPSLYEGLGLVLIEAQACGVPCIISNVIPEEADICKEMIFRVNLAARTCEWAERIMDVRKIVNHHNQKQCLNMIEKSEFNIKTCVEMITELYRR